MEGSTQESEHNSGPSYEDGNSGSFSQEAEDSNRGYLVNQGGCGVYLVDEEFDGNWNEGENNEDADEVSKTSIDGLEDIEAIDLQKFSPHQITNFDFCSVDVAYQFYFWYAWANGFASRRGKVISSKKTGMVLQQNFFCNREGIRLEDGVPLEEKQREPKAVTRCGCRAEFRAHVDINTGRWYCSYFYDKHNHELLDPIFCSMLPAHRKMTSSDVNQMNNMLKVGIGPPQIFESFANQCGGYEKIGFRKKDIYNQISQQRRMQQSDAAEAVKFLRGLGQNDQSMFFRHTTSEDGRNATANVGKPGFTADFESCMLANYEVGMFQRKWNELVVKYGVEDKPWIRDMYEKRDMWATAYMRGKFFVGFRTTSRCEGLHSELSKFVHSKHNLTDFLQHFFQCVDHMRFKEIEDDFASIHGDPVLQTSLHDLEESAAKFLTREVFFLFRPVLEKAAMMSVIGCKELYSSYVYTIRNRRGLGKEWSVSYNPSCGEYKCQCMWFESHGLPCSHIVVVLCHLDIKELPNSVLLRRWTKGAEDMVNVSSGQSSAGWDSQKVFRVEDLNFLYRKLSVVNGDTVEDYYDTREKLLEEYEMKKAKKAQQRAAGSEPVASANEGLRDPLRAREKGTSQASMSAGGLRVKRTTKCSWCRVAGHNRVTCPLRAQSQQMSQAEPQSSRFDDEEGNYYNCGTI
ncbi:Zinc finger, PMZ-type [Sesbania bispinosa]|nr:Zinc finger, PMZ-type [Sesbania bispinosa]